MKPIASKSSNRVGWSVAAIVGVLLLLTALNGRSSNDALTPENNSASIISSDNTFAGNVPPTSAPRSNWIYLTDSDKIRGTTTYLASTTSTNSIHQSAPYDGDTTMELTVRKSADGSDVMFRISSGQMMCPSYEGCSGTVRFDDGPAEHVRFNGPSDDSSEVIFIAGTKSFIAKLKRAKRIVVEKTLYQAGAPQFEFDTSNLHWSH